MDEGAIKSFAEQSHKLGLNNAQAQGILEFYKNNMESTLQVKQLLILKLHKLNLKHN
jgi:hypothetical protein